MSRPGGLSVLERDYISFNESLVFFIPKKVSGFDDQRGEFYDSEHTRPITVTNFDKRILASALRLRIEPILARWVSPQERGFIGGRSTLANVIDVDLEMQRIALEQDDGFAVMFDFKVAFPSVGHSFKLDLFEHLGLPDCILEFVRALYLVAFGPSRHRAWVVGQRPLACSLGSHGRPLWSLWEVF